MSSQFPEARPRRLRRNASLRSLFQETEFSLNDLVLPIFVEEEIDDFVPIRSMPGVMRIPESKLAGEIERYARAGIKSVMTFGVSRHLDSSGSDTWRENGLVSRMSRIAKDAVPDMIVMSDTCFCEYTEHGHCGALCKVGDRVDVDNYTTLRMLGHQALAHAKAGADVVAPSGMMDGMIGAIRRKLDQAGFTHVPIMSYAVKYASSFYGPFREAAESAPQFGDRKTHQMDPANGREALREVERDIEEGAYIVMVKPAGPYLDVLARVKDTFGYPTAAYQVSGEYAMLKAAGRNGWIDERRAMLESLTGIRRAGADIVITYFAREAARALA